MNNTQYADNKPYPIPWHQMIWIFGASVVFIGILGLIGKLSEIYIIGSYLTYIKPIASTSSVCYILLGSVMYMYGRNNLHGMMKVSSIIILSIITLFSIAIIAYSIMSINTDILQLSFFNTQTQVMPYSDYPSAIGALLITLSGLSLILLLISKEKLCNYIGILGLMIALSGLVISIYYISGISLQTYFISPIPFPSAIACLLIGTGIILSAGNNCFLTRPLSSSATASSLMKYFIPAIIFIEIISDLIHDVFIHRLKLSNPWISEVITIIATLALVVVFSIIAYYLSKAVQKSESDRRGLEKEKEEIEKQLIQAQKIETVGHLAAGIAHDFNNFLAGIQANVELARKNSTEKDREKSDDFFNEIEMLIARSTSIISQILSFSGKNKKGKPKLVNVNDIVDESTVILKHTAINNVVMTFTPSPDLWLVNADPSMIIQVLLNLGLNAIEAMPDGGKLTMKTQNIHIDDNNQIPSRFLNNGDYINITVTDTGKGIKPEIISKIFDPFFTTKPVGKGSGLGLSIAYNIIRQNNGYIFVDSEDGHGTVFSVYLPAENRDSLVKNENKTIPVLKIPACQTALLADDEDYIRNVVKRILKDAGIETITAVNGEEAVEKYIENKGKIGFVILDLKMPGIGGLEAFNRICKINPSVKTVFITGYSEEINLTEHKNCILVKKPFRINEFTQAIADLLKVT